MMSTSSAEPLPSTCLGELDPPESQRWLTTELQTLALGDSRRNERCQRILHRLSRHPNFKFNSACDSDAEVDGAYRFVDNRYVTEQKIFAPHFTATGQRIQQHPVVILVNDTTENDLTRPRERMQGAGPLNDADRWGLFVHPLLAFTPDRIPLGLTDVYVWARDPEEFAQSAQAKAAARKKKPIEEKESIRWLNSYAAACRVAAASPNTQIIYVGDSEADIFELFHVARPEVGVKKVEWLVRACQDRALEPAAAVEPLTNAAESPMDDTALPSSLFAAVAATPVLATMEIAVSERPAQTGDGRKRKQARQARTATVTIQAHRVELRAPARRQVEGSLSAGLTAVAVQAVLVRELNPPAGEEAIEWLLLTSLPIDTLAQVQAVIATYCVRWQIEIYFRVLKSGCEVEKSQLEIAHRYKNYLALCMIVAWRVMYLLMLGRQCPELPCDQVLEEDEWQAVYTVVTEQALPATVPTLGLMLLLIASLGGHMGRPSDGEPGPKATWRGLQRMADLVKGWRAAKASLRQAQTETAGPSATGPASPTVAEPPLQPPTSTSAVGESGQGFAPPLPDPGVGSVV